MVESSGSEDEEEDEDATPAPRARKQAGGKKARYVSVPWCEHVSKVDAARLVQASEIRRRPRIVKSKRTLTRTQSWTRRLNQVKRRMSDFCAAYSDIVVI